MNGRALLIALAALHGLAGLGFASVAAHAAGGDTVMTAATIQMIHAAAALGALALFPNARFAPLCFILGALLFSGALYTAGIAGRSLGFVAPLGGGFMMIGWLALAIAALRR